MDMDGLVEVDRHFMFIEAKRVGTVFQGAQRNAFDRLVHGPHESRTGIVLYGEPDAAGYPGVPREIEIIEQGQEPRWVRDTDVARVRDVLRCWGQARVPWRYR